MRPAAADKSREPASIVWRRRFTRAAVLLPAMLVLGRDAPHPPAVPPTGPAFNVAALSSVASDRETVDSAPATGAVATTTTHRAPLFPAMANADRQGFVRVINHSSNDGEVTIVPVDDEGVQGGKVTLSISANNTLHFNSDDLETGNEDKNLTGSSGPPTGGDWRLELESELDIEVLSYIRTSDGFLTAMHDTAPLLGNRHRIAIFNPGQNENQVSLLRLINPGDAAVDVTITGVDDDGETPGTDVRVSVPAGASRTLSAQELESGGAGFDGALGDGKGKWQLTVEADQPIIAMSLLRSPTQHLTNLSTAPVRGFGGPVAEAEEIFRARVSNPVVQSKCINCHVEGGQSGGTRLVFTESSDAHHATTNFDVFQDFLGEVDGGRELILDKIQGISHTGGVQIAVGTTDFMTMEDFLELLDFDPASVVHNVPLMPPAGDPSGRQGFVRVINHDQSAGEVTITAADDSDADYPAITLSLDANETAHFNSDDLEDGNADKGLSDGVGAGEGDWYLQATSELDIEVLAYIRTEDGFLTAMHDLAPSLDNRHRLAIFNPGRNTNQVSRLRLVNPGEQVATVTITGSDDRDESAADDVTVSVPAGTARTLSAQDLESGTEGFEGALGAGTGKWQLAIEADVPIWAMSLLESPTRHLTNLSTTPGRGTEETTDEPEGETAEDVYESSISDPIVQSKCINCHVEGGQSGNTRLVFVDSNDPDHIDHNLAAFRELVDEEGATYILNRIQGLSNHGGGEQVAAGSTDYANMVRFLGLLREDTTGPAEPTPISDEVGHPTFASPHFRPIAVNGSYVYATNTPADTVDIIDVEDRSIIGRVHVGVDPVGLGVRPDGKELWVANHISDSVSVIDTDPSSPTFHEVVATIQDVDPHTLSTRFDEPVGIAFANDAKAYVTLSTTNRVAVVDVASRTVTGHLRIRAQDPRALVVRGGRLYVAPFESNNQSQLSGCLAERIDGDECTFDAVQHVFTTNNVLSTGYDADIVKNPRIPDRDIFIFDTATDTQLRVVHTAGTLLYGLAVDSTGTVFVAQTDARNTANGRAGTRKHGLAEMENRAFLNQITRVDCATSCQRPEFLDLEPLPPDDPQPGMALATPFGIEISDDDATLVVTAAGSDKVFTLDAETGDVLGRVAVDEVPRGVALESDDTGAPSGAWVLNVVANTVSVVDLTSVANPTVIDTIALEDPTHPDVKLGRMAFNDADASSTDTFSCESCHPDNHTDQLIWVLQTPICDVDGCTQIPPRLTMPVRGLRDTQPYHWDGIPGDPYGGNNTASINAAVEPNCDVGDEESCARFLVDGSLATTMCDPDDCPVNDEGKDGLLDSAVRDALARYILSVPYPPAQTRPFDNELTQRARDGFFEFSFINDSGESTGAQTCGDCHKMPFLVSSNTPGTGMDAPTWRGAYDRFIITPQARTNVIDLMHLVNMDDTFPERNIWLLGGASPDIWEMVVQGGTGFSGSFARQTTLNTATADLPLTGHILDALETSDTEGAILLQAEGARVDGDQGTAVALEFDDGLYREREGTATYSRSQLIQSAANGELVLTLTGRTGLYVDVDHPQPALWPVAAIHSQTRNVGLAFLSDELTLRINGRHVRDGAFATVDGRRVDARIRCEIGTLPDCDGEVLIVELDSAPDPGGLHFLQIQNPNGLVSNDMMIFNEQSPLDPRPGNLITSGGTFAPSLFSSHNEAPDSFRKRNNWNTVEFDGVVADISWNNEVNIDMIRAANRPWESQISHAVTVIGGQEYTLCYDAKARANRPMTAYTDTNMDRWENTSGQQFRVDLTTQYQTFKHTFTIAETDLRGRVAFDLAQSPHDVQMDNIGLYEGSECGDP